MIFIRENFDDIIEEMEPYFTQHYNEVGWRREQIPLGINYDLYRQMDAAGTCLFFTGRVGGELKAYASFLIHRHPHFNTTLYAANDVVYVDPRFRGIGGVGLIRCCERELKALGAQVITLAIKKSADWGDLAEKLGYEPTETVWQKWIGD